MIDTTVALWLSSRFTLVLDGVNDIVAEFYRLIGRLPKIMNGKLKINPQQPRKENH